MLIGNMTYNLNQTLNRMEMLQYQSSTGKKFRVPSDDPIGASKSLKIRTDMSKIGQYQRNVGDAKSWMTETESALKEMNVIVKRAYELTVQASNGINAGEDLEKIKAEITELKDNVIQLANSSYGGRTIFTGHDTDEKLLDKNGNYLVDLSKDEVVEYNVGVSETVKVNTLGNKIFGKAEYEKDVNGEIKLDEDGNKILKQPLEADYTSEIKKGDKSYVIALLEDLEKNLETENAEGIQNNISELQDIESNLLSVGAEIGARTNRLELTEEKLKNQALNLEDLLSGVEDVSLPETYMRLLLEKNVYNASLSVGSQIIQPSLVDFIR